MLKSLRSCVGGCRSLGSIAAAVGAAMLSLSGAEVQAQCGTSVLWHDGGEVTASHATSAYYLGGAANELRIYSMSDPAAPVLLSTYILDGRPRKIEKDGNFVFVALGDRGVEIIDMTNPAAPLRAFSIAGGTALDVAVSSGKLFICWNGDIRAYDIANPASPQFLSTYSIGDAIEIESRNNIAFAMGGYTVTAVDFQNGAAPVFRDNATFASTTRRMDVRPGTLAVLADNDIFFFDITAPSNITQVSTLTNVAYQYDDGTCEFGQADGVPVLYFVNDFLALDAVSIANPASPQPMPTIKEGVGFTSRVAAPAADRVHLATGSGLITYASTLSGASLLSSLSMGPMFFQGMVAAGNALVAAPGEVLLVYDATDPASPVLASTLTMPDLVSAIASDGTTVYVQITGELLHTYDVSNPAAPVLLGEDTLLSDAFRMVATDGYLYVSNWNDKFNIYRVADPNNVRRKSSIDVPSEGPIVEDGGFVYVCTVASIDVYDAADPSNPELIASIPPTGAWGFLQLELLPGHILISATQVGLIEAWDVSNPSSPALRSSVNVGSLVPRIHAAGSLLVVSESTGTLVDWADPGSPVVLPQTLRQSGQMDFGAMIGDVCFGSSLFGGIDAFDLPGLPRLIEQPEAQPVCLSSTSVQLSVTPAEPAGVTYQWRRGGFPMADGTTSWGTTISGVTTATLTFSNPHAQDLALYDCVITNSCGSITSRTVALFPGVAPQIVIQPEDTKVCPSGSATFSVGWVGTLPATFAWQAEVPAGSGNWIGVTDADFARFTIEGSATRFLTISAQPGETLPELVQARYRCTVTNVCGSATTDPATLLACVADYNCDGFINGDDYDDFATYFEEGDPLADVNLDGFVNGDDYDLFAEAFDAGC